MFDSQRVYSRPSTATKVFYVYVEGTVVTLESESPWTHNGHVVGREYRTGKNTLQYFMEIANVPDKAVKRTKWRFSKLLRNKLWHKS